MRCKLHQILKAFFGLFCLHHITITACIFDTLHSFLSSSFSFLPRSHSLPVSINDFFFLNEELLNEFPFPVGYINKPSSACLIPFTYGTYINSSQLCNP